MNDFSAGNYPITVRRQTRGIYKDILLCVKDDYLIGGISGNRLFFWVKSGNEVKQKFFDLIEHRGYCFKEVKDE
jgi:hypothetical protein